MFVCMSVWMYVFIEIHICICIIIFEHVSVEVRSDRERGDCEVRNRETHE